MFGVNEYNKYLKETLELNRISSVNGTKVHRKSMK